jgi:hypothetical protein
MRTISIALALSAIVLTGCVPAPVDPDVACRPRTITLNTVRNASIAITHPTVDMCRGLMLTIRVVPPVNGAESTAGPENAGATWLNKSVSEDGRRIEIVVPSEGVESGAEFKYTLTLPGVGALDPTIRIIR